MGEYFTWANPAKKEYLEDDPFGCCGFMLSIATLEGCGYTDAACTMIAGPWHGSPVVFVGDYWNSEKDGRAVARLFGGYAYEMILDDYENVTGRFKEARGLTYEVYGDNPDALPAEYQGPFDLEVHRFRYLVNRDRREYVDRFAAPGREIENDEDGTTLVREDPVAWLYAPCSASPAERDGEWRGRWCCDLVDPLDDFDSAGYKDVTQEVCRACGWS